MGAEQPGSGRGPGGVSGRGKTTGREGPRERAARSMRHAQAMVEEYTRKAARDVRLLHAWTRKAAAYARRAAMSDEELARERTIRQERAARRGRIRGIKFREVV